jgi:hypothetical protein
MTAGKILGYLFIIISIALALAIVGQIPRLFHDISGFLNVFRGNLDSYEIAKAVTTFILWIIHFILVVILWRAGRKHLK